MNMHGCGELGVIHQQNQITTCYSGTAGCRPPFGSVINHPLALVFSRDQTAKISKIPLKKQTQLNFYTRFDRPPRQRNFLASVMMQVTEWFESCSLMVIYHRQRLYRVFSYVAALSFRPYHPSCCVTHACCCVNE